MSPRRRRFGKVSALATGAVGLVLGSSAVVPVPAGAARGAQGWSIQDTASLGARTTALVSDSCRAPRSCVAVGDSRSATAAAAVWDGSKWAAMSTPKLPGMSILEGVSCSSATECIAVGHSATSYATALAEAWGGSAWAVQPTARLAGAAGRDSYLKAVSCTTPRTCTAVGYVDGPGGFSPSKALAEAWDGSEWTAQAVPAPAGAVQSWLYGVSCSSAEACTAVGYYDPSGTSATLLSLAEEWDGSRWTVQKTPNYAAAAWSYLYSVSCVSATACTAVGSYTPAAAVGNYHPHTYVKTLAEAWDGSTWAFEPTPGPGANVPSTYELKSVSCTSASSCIAVGCHGTGLNCSDTLAEVWDGSTWEPQATANLPAVEGNNLLGVSCAGNSCAAVGYSFTKAASVALVEGERH